MKTVKQNFLVFRGTRKEVDDADVIDRCWYLAWDTGELFVGNSVGSKTKYGGNSQTMSKTEIIDYIESQFNSYKDQFATHNSIIHDMDNKIDSYRNELMLLRNETEEYLKEEIDKVLKDIDSLKITFVTKDEIKAYAQKTDLEDYLKKSEVSSNFILPMTGQEIVNNINNHGYYLCTLDYNYNSITLYKGTIYRITNKEIEEISSPGGPGGSGQVGPTIDFFSIDSNILNVVKFIPDDLSELFNDPKNVTVQTQITNGSKFTVIALYYKYQNETSIELKNISGKLNTMQTFSIDIDYLIGKDKLKRPGNHRFIISGQTVSGSVVSSEIIYQIVRPIYYGAAGSSLISAEVATLNTDLDIEIDVNINIKAKLNKAEPKVNPNGEYTIEFTVDKPYAWFCVPSGDFNDRMTITKVTPKNSMADMPIMEQPNELADYICYRSVNGNIAHTAICTVEGKGNI